MTRNPTELALIRRGVDAALAKTLRERKWTVAKLQQQSHQQLIDLGLSEDAILALRGTGRPPIPSETLVKVLFANRWVCCVCRDTDLPVVVHHIKAWAESHDHSAENLAVLCSIHHGEAHTSRTLEQNLTADRLRKMKVAWERKVRRRDNATIFNSSMITACQWWYFNHLRIFEIAHAYDVDLTQLDGFQGARSANLCDDKGVLHESDGLMYRASAGLILQHYMTNMLQVSLADIRVQNISDDLDRGTLNRLITEGELIFVQGCYTFKDLPSSAPGEDWVSGRRHANGIEISFVFNRNEGTSGSARNLWLRGRQNLGCLLRVNKLHKDLKGRLQITATVLAIRSAQEELKSRLYEIGLYLSGLAGHVDEDGGVEDGELEGDEDEFAW